MNHHETIRKRKSMHLHKILFHLIHIGVHIEQSRRLLFLSWMVCRGGTNSRALPLKNLKVTTRNVFIHMVPHSRCIDIVMLCEVYTGEVCYLFYFKFFCDATFTLALLPTIALSFFSALLMWYIHLYYCGPPTLASYGRCTSKCCIGLNHPGGKIFSNLHESTGISFSNFSIISFLISLAQSCL